MAVHGAAFITSSNIGRSPDPKPGEAGKERSVYNNYLTLPVLVLMISNHYPLLSATR